jgi:pectate lyase
MSKSSWLIAIICGLAGCSEATDSPSVHVDAAPLTGGKGSGGATGSAGATTTPGTGGSLATGGATGQGGALGTGGLSGGGKNDAGVVVATGGVNGTGGASSTTATATGGRSGTGGSQATGGTPGSGGATGKGGALGAGGTPGAGGATGKGGTQGTGGATTPASGPSCSTTLPAANGKTTVTATITVSGTKDYSMQQLCADPDKLGPGDQSESQKPVIQMEAGAVLKNVIIGGSGCSAADGVHCEKGSCTLENVWFGDVGEDAISFKGSDKNQVMTINGGGAFSASDKVIQHNGPGTIKISNFFVSSVGKVYRSCGNCGTQYARHVVFDHVVAKSAKYLAGINANYGDTATFSNITICSGSSTTICERYTGNDTGDEPPAIGSGPDSKSCLYSTSDITTM